jgi:hypothetical protein
MSREKSIYFARLAEQGERYEDMIKYMKEVVKVSLKFKKAILLIVCESISMNLMLTLL